MIALDSTTAARLSAGALGLAWLIELDFSPATLRYTTWGQDVTATVDGVVRTYGGLGNALSVGQVRESEDASAEQITLSLSLANTAVLGAALGSVHTYRGRPARLYLQAFDTAGVIDGVAVRRYTGVMDRVSVAVEEDATTGTRTGRVDLHCSRIGMARARHAEGLRLSHMQHQRDFPGDLFYERMTDLIEKPRPWLSVAFQRV